MSDPSYRITLRYGAGRQYHIMDVSATSLREALARLVAEYPDLAADADLVEVRRQADPGQRAYAPE